VWLWQGSAPTIEPYRASSAPAAPRCVGWLTIYSPLSSLTHSAALLAQISVICSAVVGAGLLQQGLAVDNDDDGLA